MALLPGNRQKRRETFVVENEHLREDGRGASYELGDIQHSSTKDMQMTNLPVSFMTKTFGRS